MPAGAAPARPATRHAAADVECACKCSHVTQHSPHGSSPLLPRMKQSPYLFFSCTKRESSREEELVRGAAAAYAACPVH